MCHRGQSQYGRCSGAVWAVKQVPVYLFTGFLEAGKTTFIQETLEDSRFNEGERTLLLLCEDGEVEYDPSRFSGTNVFTHTLESEADIQPEALTAVLNDCRAERVIVEYNGMWMLDTLFFNMPQNWIVVQEYLFFDASTFLPYNANMRQLVYDKLKSCELVVLNRSGDDLDREEIHKIVRAANRRCDICYEHPDGVTEYDDIEDPLPFDLEAPVVDIRDEDYALFYMDVTDDMAKYAGKTLRYKAMVVKSPRLAGDTFVFGRKVMTCCANDIQFAGLICRWPDATSLDKGQWLTITASVEIKWHLGYGKKGPVLMVTDVIPSAPPAQPIATFY